MGLLSQLGLKPTPGLSGAQGAPASAKVPPEKSPEMKSLVARFQEVMGKIKALEAGKAPDAGALKKATIAAGNLSTSPKGIVAANAALDKVEAQIVDAKRRLADAQPAQGAPAGGASDGKALAAEARKRLKSLEARGRKAIAADPRNPNDGWLTEVVGNSEGRLADLERLGTQREIDSMREHLDWLEESVVRFESDAKGEPRAEDAALPDVAKTASEARARLKSLDERGRKAIAADPGNTNADWLAGVVADFEGRILDLEERKTLREANDVRKQLDWLEKSVASFEADAERNGSQGADAPKAKPKPKKAEDSPALKQAKAHYKHVMGEIKKLAAAKVPQAAALKQAAIDAANLATSPKGIEQAMRALDMVLSDAIQAKEDAPKATPKAKTKTKAKDKDKAGAEQGEAEAEAATAETFDLTVGGRKLSGVGREEAMQALRAEVRKLSAQLEGGWAYHVDQMNLPAELPFQAWLTTGVDAVKSFVTGQDAARIPDLNIWDPAREMMIEVKKAERKGDVQAIAALLPKIATAIPQARAKVGKYQEQMEGSAETGVEAGRFVEDTSASAIGAIAEKKGGKAGKIAAQAAAQGVFQGVEQLTEWLIGTRQHADPDAIGKKMVDEAVGAIFKELVAGKLKDVFKGAFGSYLGKSVSDATLKTMNLSRDAFMTAGQKYFAEFAAKQGAGLIKSAIAKLIGGKLPSSPEAMVDAIAADLMKGSAKQLIVDGIKEIAKAAVASK